MATNEDVIREVQEVKQEVQEVKEELQEIRLKRLDVNKFFALLLFVPNERWFTRSGL